MDYNEIYMTFDLRNESTIRVPGHLGLLHKETPPEKKKERKKEIICCKQEKLQGKKTQQNKTKKD